MERLKERMLARAEAVKYTSVDDAYTRGYLDTINDVFSDGKALDKAYKEFEDTIRKKERNEYAKKVREKKRGTGLCTFSGCTDLPVLNKKMCAKHQEYLKERSAKRIKDKNEQGLCGYSSCQNKNAEGRVYCSDHLAAMSEKQKSRHVAHTT